MIICNVFLIQELVNIVAIIIVFIILCLSSVFSGKHELQKKMFVKDMWEVLLYWFSKNFCTSSISYPY